LFLEAKVVAIADAYQEMVSPRTYKKKLSKEEAIAELRKNKGKQFDATLVEIFINKVL